MAVWQSSLVSAVRAIVQDFKTPPDFDDQRIMKSLVIGGLLSSQDFPTPTTYFFDIQNFDIVPDPVEINDSLAMTLFSLKASCLLSQGQAREAAGNAIEVQDGDSRVNLGSSLNGFLKLMEIGPCRMYQNVLKDIKIYYGSNVGGAVMTPISHPNMGYYGGFSSWIGDWIRNPGGCRVGGCC